MVHRWSAATLSGTEVDPDALEALGHGAPDPLEWLRDGAIEVAQAVTAAADDAPALVFLNDAPPARRFWARRQCHETTIHAVDALAAALGRYPRAEDTWLEPALAVDGIDELLGGFLTRPRSRLRTEEDTTLVVAPDDAEDWWEVRLGPRPPVTTRRTGVPAEGDVELTGPAVGLYLALWNRSGEAYDRKDKSGLFEDWRDRSAVRWS
ncbi:MAG: hypothetical protein JWN22_269 [Nocardioides sp.]|jgi:uncharacterized protein (TIGR03083 family)|nr:hypothetical protein [Nocardioides sp.]